MQRFRAIRQRLDRAIGKPLARRGGLFFDARRDDHGATAVEFALVAPIVIAFLFGLIQIGVVYFARSVLDTGTENTARLVLVGSAQSLTAAQFQSKLCANLPGIFSCAGLMVNMQPAASLASISTATPKLTYDSRGNVTNAWAYDPGSTGSVMVLQVMYQLPVIAGPLFGFVTQSNGTLLLISNAVFINEPS